MSSQTPVKTTYNLKKPVAAYLPTKDSPLYANRELYDSIAATAEKGERELVEKFIIPIRSEKDSGPQEPDNYTVLMSLSTTDYGPISHT
ncbi:unnamed protein product [[Candida] boidinii]|nr:unnamed protein product [[Candida] boidinii]